MSFYLDEFEDDLQDDIICPHCEGHNFYSDPASGTLTCSSCFTQSQSQHEEIDVDDGLGLAARSGKRSYIASTKGTSGLKAGRPSRDLREFDSDRKLPDAEGCCLAFQWLLLDASKHVVKLSGMREQHANGYAREHHDSNQDESNHSILEVTVKRIWFAYLHKWTEAAQHYSKIYPEMRVSFRDLFLSETRRSVIAGHLSIIVGKRVEEEMIQEMQMKLQSESQDDQMSAFSSDSSNGASSKSNKSWGDSSTKSATKHIMSIPQLCLQVFKSQETRDSHRQHNGCYQIDPYEAILQTQPSLTLLLSIIQLALTHLKTGYAAYHLTSWVANGLLPHVLNGYALLPSVLKRRVAMVKKFFVRSFVPTADAVDDLAFLLAASIGWLDAAIPREGDSTTASENESKDKNEASEPDTTNLVGVYNVPVLAARMVKDLGFDQKVLDNALCLMGIPPQKETHQSTFFPLAAAAIEKLYTPLHVAAVLVVACKLCRGWESWAIYNAHTSEKARFIPWNDSHLQFMGNGTTTDHYIDFLEYTALNGLTCSNSVSRFFDNIHEGMASQSQPTKRAMTSKRQASVVRNDILSGEPNHTKINSRHSSKTFSDELQYITSNDREDKGRIETSSLLHPSYTRLIEHVCYTLEETNPEKLHALVVVLEKELINLTRTYE